MSHKLSLYVVPDKFTISKLPQFAEIPSILANGEMCFIARTEDELSIISPEFMAPNNVQQEIGWRCIKIEGEQDLKNVGTVAAVAQPLADAKIPILAISTFNTDYIFLMEENLVTAVQALQKAGHEFVHKEL